MKSFSCFTVNLLPKPSCYIQIKHPKWSKGDFSTSYDFKNRNTSLGSNADSLLDTGVTNNITNYQY